MKIEGSKAKVKVDGKLEKEFESLSQEEKERIGEAWESIRTAFMQVADNVKAAFKAVAEGIINWRRSVDEDAKAGNVNALYVQATLEKGYWEGKLRDLEKTLAVTKQTVARKRLLDRKKFIQAQVDKWNKQQLDALEKAGADL